VRAKIRLKINRCEKTRKSERNKCDIDRFNKKDKQNIEVHHLLIDFQAPYDTARRKEIWSEMHKVGSPPKNS
jgi:hypothetical protein